MLGISGFHAVPDFATSSSSVQKPRSVENGLGEGRLTQGWKSTGLLSQKRKKGEAGIYGIFFYWSIIALQYCFISCVQWSESAICLKAEERGKWDLPKSDGKGK